MTSPPEGPTTPASAEGKSRLKEILEFVTQGHSPLQVGDVALDEDGGISLRRGNDLRQFTFAYRGIDFLTRMETHPIARVTLSAELGKIPYSMEPGPNRRLTRRIVEATADLPGGRIEVSKSQDMLLVASAQPPAPLTPASVMATITSLLLEFRPYLDLLRDALNMEQSAPNASADSNSPPALSQAR